MNLKTLPFFAIMFVATAIVVGCGPQNDPRLSDADIAYMKQQRLSQASGNSAGTTTATSTVVNYVTITNTTTVNH
jgi:hypothetical protein